MKKAHFICDRDQQENGSDQVYWLAHASDPHERKRVVWNAQTELCGKMESVLGIPSQSFMRALLLDTPVRQQERLMGLLASYGMKTGIEEPAQWPMQDDLESFILNGSISQGQSMRVYWNVQPHGKTVSHTGIYLVRDYPNPGEQLGTNPLVEFASDQLYADIPYSVLQNYASHNFTYVFKVVTWYEGTPGDEANWVRDVSVPGKRIQILPRSTDTISDMGDFSTLPNIPEFSERRQIENQIFRYIHMPVASDATLGNWKYTLGSPAHRNHDDSSGIESQFYELDLNIGSGDDDKGKDVNPVASGIVTKSPNQEPDSWNTVIVEHTSDILMNGVATQIVWKSKYLHMQDVSVNEGDHVDHTTHLGGVGTTGAGYEDVQGIFHPQYHLHQEILYTYNTVTYRLDMQNWLQFYEITQQ